jgi:hypothetical protein
MVKKIGQGEIFGLALVFVILILGIVIYGKYKALHPDIQKNVFKDSQMDVLAKNTLTSVRYLSTGCDLDSEDDSLQNLLAYCFDFTTSESGSNPQIDCGGPTTVNACEYAIEVFNTTLQTFFRKNTTLDKTIIAPLPFSLTFYNDRFPLVGVHNVTLTNIEDFGLSLNESNSSYYLKKRWKKANGGFLIIPTTKRPVELLFDIYYF